VRPLERPPYPSGAAAAYIARPPAPPPPPPPPGPTALEKALEATVAALAALNAECVERYRVVAAHDASAGDGAGALLPWTDLHRQSAAARAEVAALAAAPACSTRAAEAAADAAVAAWQAAVASVGAKRHASASRAELLGRMHGVGGGRAAGGGGGGGAGARGREGGVEEGARGREGGVEEGARALAAFSVFQGADALPATLSRLAGEWARAKWEALDAGARLARARAAAAAARLCKAQVLLAVRRMRDARIEAAAAPAAPHEPLTAAGEAAVRRELLELAGRAAVRDVAAGRAAALAREAAAAEAAVAAARARGDAELQALPARLEAARREREEAEARRAAAERALALAEAYQRTLHAGKRAEQWASWGRLVKLLGRRREAALPPLRARLRSILALEGQPIQGPAPHATGVQFSLQREEALQRAALGDVLRALPYAPAREARLRALVGELGGLAAQKRADGAAD
jgi:hypothetical protein